MSTLRAIPLGMFSMARQVKALSSGVGLSARRCTELHLPRSNLNSHVVGVRVHFKHQVGLPRFLKDFLKAIFHGMGCEFKQV